MLLEEFVGGVNSGDLLHTCRLFKKVLKTQKDVDLLGK